MKLKTNPIRWWAQVILVGFGLILSIYALITGESWSDWVTVFTIFILIGITMECPLLSSKVEDIENP